MAVEGKFLKSEGVDSAVSNPCSDEPSEVRNARLERDTPEPRRFW